MCSHLYLEAWPEQLTCKVGTQILPWSAWPPNLTLVLGPDQAPVAGRHTPPFFMHHCSNLIPYLPR